MQTVIIQNDYPVLAERLWALATDYGALDRVARPVLRFDGLPRGEIEAGHVLTPRRSVFGIMPWRPCRLEVLERDDARMILRSDQTGAGPGCWRHTLAVTPTAEGSRMTDLIEVEAGFLTPLAALWVHYLFAARHGPRAELLERGEF